MQNIFLRFAAVSGFINVALGAVSSHVLINTLPNYANAWIQTGLTYQMYHTIALLALGFFAVYLQQNSEKQPTCRTKALAWIGYSWMVGIVFFSFSLYTMALTGFVGIRFLVPVGGTAFLLGWLTLAVVSFRKVGSRG